MSTWSRLQKVVIVSLGVVGGGFSYYRLNTSKSPTKFDVYNSWTTDYTPSVKWDHNWDRRNPESLVKPPTSLDNEEEQNKYNEKLEKAKSKAVRHIYIVRHGEYNVDGVRDCDKSLTKLGREQAELTGQRLASLNIKWDLLVRSTLTRAQETANIIATHLNKDIAIKDCQLIEEGTPIPPEPPMAHWKPEVKYFEDSARIEAAFRRYFHRAPPEQTEDTHTIIVCHANVIRYFVCKALQLPPEAWLRMSLCHGSITWISIHSGGKVILHSLGDAGYMAPSYLTSE